MSAVAIAAGTPEVAARHTEADVVRSAARADRGAFDELYRRHHQVTWRLAQAVAEREAAADAVAEGFSQVLRNVRRQRSLAEQPFRSQVLAATYRAGMAPARGEHVEESGTADAPSAVLAAFRSLPDRWRAALWLADVEHLSPSAVGAVIGVSSPVAGQLADRGRQGLLSRFAQVGVTRPDHLDAVLRPLAGAPPAALEALAAKRWRSAVVVDPGGRLVPLSEWLARRAPRPLMTACGGLLALGMVGLGVLTVASPPATTGPAAAISAPSLNGSVPLNPSGSRPNELFGPGAPGSQALIGGLPLNDNLAADVNPILAGEGSADTLSGAPGALPSQGGGAGGATPAAGSTGGAAPGGGAGAPTGSPASPPASGGGTAPAPVVNLPPVATVTTPSTGGATVSLGGGAVGATISPTCTGIQVLDIVTNKCVTPAPPPAAAPAPNPVSNVVNGVTNTVNGVTSGLGLGG